MEPKDKALLEEQKKLKQVKDWLDYELTNKSTYKDALYNKVKELKKASKGSYSEELEKAKTLYEIAEKNFSNYSEAMEQPYFARIDFREYKHLPETLYIGKFSLSNEKTGDEVVIDWRAPVADLYYSGTEGEAYYRAPQGVISGELSLKRKFLYEEGKIKDIFDEGINELIIKSSLGEEALIDEFLRINLESSTGRKLKDVVATIQKEQNEVIRAEKNIPIIVQGAAGSGKTTVALHRLAYLLYRYQGTVAGNNILVIAPNLIFLDYISEVLPSLGVDEVKQSTFENLAKEVLGIKNKLYTKDKKLAWVLENKDSKEYKYVINTSRVKGTLIYKTILDRYLKIVERNMTYNEPMTYESSVIFTAEEIKRLFYKELAHLNVSKRKEELQRYLKSKLEGRIKELQDKSDFQYEYLIARSKKTMEDGPERRKKLVEIYNDRDESRQRIKQGVRDAFKSYFNKDKNINFRDLYSNLFIQEDLFDEATGGIIPKALADYMKESYKKSLDEGIIDSEDLYGMLYLKIMYQGLSEEFKFGHVVVDEAQDYSLFELMLISKFTNYNSLTIVGDIGQGIYYYKGINDWNTVIKEIFSNNAVYMPLSQSYRSTVEIISLANDVLKEIESDLIPPRAVLRHGREPELIKFTDNKELGAQVDVIAQRIKDMGKKSVAIICKDIRASEELFKAIKGTSKNKWEIIRDNNKIISMDLMIIPAFLTKGLEFDCSIIYDCSKEVYKKDKEDGRLLYVSLTRALHEEYIIYKNEPSGLLLDYINKKN
ncbi:MAG: RNA polymerase recycling motor HelD [Clostridiaceae bacterium]